MRSRKAESLIALTVAAVLAASGALRAAEDVWDAAVSGSFGDDARWADGNAPTSADSATFDAAGTYDVLFDYDPVNQGLVVEGAGVDVTFYGDGGTRVYSLTYPGGTPDVEVVGGAALTLGMVGAPLDVSIGNDLVVSTGGTLDIVEGSEVSAVGLMVGAAGGADSTVTVAGAGSSLTVGSGPNMLGNGSRGDLVFQDFATGEITGDLRLGGKMTANSEGVLTVQSGATLSLANLQVGTGGQAGQIGTITVTGSGSEITQTGSSTLTLGAASNSTGELHVDSGGGFNTAAGTTTVDAMGLIEINGGTFNANGDVDIAGGQLTCSATGTFAPAAGTTVTISGGGSATFAGDYALDVAATIEITAAGSELETIGGLGLTGGGQIDVSTDGVLSVHDVLDVGTGDGSGTLMVTDGGDVASATGCIGRDANSTGDVTVTQAGSTWTNVGGLQVGSAGEGGLYVFTGGVVSSATGVVGAGAGAVGSATVNGPGATWTNTGDLTVGDSGTGQVGVWYGGSLSCVNAIAGAAAGADGEVTVTGPTASWTCSGGLSVGGSGTGSLSIAEGADVTSGLSLIGAEAGSQGTVTVDGASSTWTSTDPLSVGSWGTGTLTITDGGAVSNGNGHVGGNADSTGTATVSGSGSTWTNAGILCVGNHGEGTLSILAGGAVSNTEGYIAVDGAATGSATVDGGGSTWASSTWLRVGNHGAGTLAITNDGDVSSPDGYVGYYSDGNGSVTADGAGSTWTNTGDLSVGEGGRGTLEVTGGGTVSDVNGLVGNLAGSDGSVIVSGPGSTWTNTGSLSVGAYGVGALSITAGGTVTNTIGSIGLQAVSEGTVSVSGASSAWTQSGTLYVAYLGDGTLTIEAGGSVSNAEARLAADPDVEAAVTVDGAGSTWSNGGELNVGWAGRAWLTVSGGGAVTSPYGYLGRLTGSHGTARVTGPNSTWITCMHVGEHGTGVLEIADGGLVTGTGIQSVGHEADGNGLVTVDGAGSSWYVNGWMYVGASGVGAMHITNGGSVRNTQAYVGLAEGSAGTVTVDGSGSTWTNASASLTVGSSGQGTLAITNGGAVTSQSAFFGQVEGSEGWATVDGAGSALTLSGNLYVGNQGGGSLTVSNGGLISNNEGHLGDDANGQGSVTVSGAGSQWVNDGDLYVGKEGSGLLNIEGGGYVSNESAYVGYASGAYGDAFVDGNGSTWDCSQSLHVGSAGTGILNVTNGGSVHNTGAYLGDDPSGYGSVAVHGEGSTWTSTSYVYIGGAGHGTLDVTDGATSTMYDSVTIATEASAEGTVNVDGAGSTWNAGSYLRVAYEGQAWLNVTGGAVVSGEAAAVGFDTGSEGTVTLSGGGAIWSLTGGLTVGGASINGGTGRVDVWPGATLRTAQLTLWPDGTVNLYGGTIRFEYDEPIQFNGGVLNFYAGTVEFEGDLDVHSVLNSTLWTLFGSPVTIPSGKGLGVAGTATLLEPVTVDGGTFSFGDLVNASLLQLNSGTLNLTDANLTVGPGGMFGETIALAYGHTFNVTNTATVAPSGLIMLFGGAFSAGDLVNEGQVQLGGGTSILGGTTLTNRGLLGGSGRITSRLVNEADGEVRAAAGEHLRFTAAGNTNAGKIEAIGGDVEFTQDLTNEASTGLITGRDARLRFTGGLTNDGSLALSFGTSDVFGDIQNSATGEIVVSGASNATFYDDVINDGEVHVSDAAAAVYFGAFSGNGVTGTGENYFEGDLRPGHSAGIMDFEGSVTLRPTARLEVELANPDNSDPLNPRYDALHVAGDVTLAGTLSPTWLPVPGDASSKFGGDYDLITYTEAGDLTGEFDEIDCDFSAYLAGIDYHVDVHGDGSGFAVRLTLHPLIDGDVDFSGVVDYDDYATLRDAYGTTADARWADGDCDLDGDVDWRDYAALKRHWGMALPGAPGAPVPEPATLSLLALGALALIPRKRT